MQRAFSHTLFSHFAPGVSDLIHYCFYILFSWLPNIISLTYFISTFDEKHDNKKSKLDKFWYIEVSPKFFQNTFLEVSHYL